MSSSAPYATTMNMRTIMKVSIVPLSVPVAAVAVATTVVAALWPVARIACVLQGHGAILDDQLGCIGIARRARWKKKAPTRKNIRYSKARKFCTKDLPNIFINSSA